MDSTLHHYFYSLLLETRCQVHSELALIEEEEGRLEAALTHLQKAMLLDNGTHRERLSSAVRLLQLRGALYQTPSRAEDKAEMLMQQVFFSPSVSLSNITMFNGSLKLLRPNTVYKFKALTANVQQWTRKS